MTAGIQAVRDPETGGIWHPHRVSYGETDAMGVMYYAEYMHVFERARGSLIRATGMPYAEIEKRGVILPVREAHCRYRAPARYDDLVFVLARISGWSRATVTFSYGLFASDRKTPLAEGMTQHACVNPLGRPIPAPAWFRELFLSGKTGAA